MTDLTDNALSILPFTPIHSNVDSEFLINNFPITFTDQEIKAYREYIIEKKNVNLLTDEDKFLMQLGKVERISTKLAIMNYIGNFFDNLHLITPQIHAVISAASSVKSSKKLRAVLEIILAFGNYLNSSKRGPAYGFKLQSLDTLLDTKSTDKRMCLLHYIVATIRLKFLELINFESELMYIDKAATGKFFD